MTLINYLNNLGTDYCRSLELITLQTAVEKKVIVPKVWILKINYEFLCIKL